MNKSEKLSWIKAVGLSALVVYIPFTIMALYAVIFVSCGHCKMTAVTFLPWAPGLMIAEFVRNLFKLPRTSDVPIFAGAFVAVICEIALLAWLIRFGRGVRITAAALAFVLLSTLAYFTLCLIRV